ncbi:energy-coupling factor transporter transmembrane component T [Micromonospora sp. ATCC 39149]|uniref:energy-coupling factor transporter transmembrane component T n=1 Tax=Micromonospora sp. (strain ATCC 39149 / NRRL 15099 / SCC 1413) TaxID=219305 RepID=UPI000564D533|nr:energy-coupling factor transporter transmembrane component T [Micromonospora sp. ATCC 39149]
MRSPAGTTRAPRLDPRTKILLVLLVSMVVTGPDGLRFVLPGLLLAAGLALWEGARRRALVLCVAVATMCVLGWLLPLWWPNPLTAIVSLTCTYLIRFTVAIGVGMHLVATTSPTELNAALRAARAPRAISVTMAVMLRFFPVVAAEAAAVRDALRLRGLTGVGAFLCHPVLSLERFTVPMIASSLRAGEDLAASAILRGLGSHRRPTALHPPRFGRPDLVWALLTAGLATAAIVLPTPLT